MRNIKYKKYWIQIVFCLLGCNDKITSIENTQISSPPIFENIGEDSLDINNDSIIDFTIDIQNYTTDEVGHSGSTTLISINPNGHFLLLNIDSVDVAPFSYGDTIQHQMALKYQWSGYGIDVASSNWNEPVWQGTIVDYGSTYLPLELSINDEIYLGWINLRLDVINDTLKVNVLEHNYNTNIGQSILAGY
ncbi:MAG: hypothetical protein H8D23_00880 [Candidatus Brocadiales bacterium]|nr:hypothetical protein [Candidatus Brocadiales bacterium]